MQWHPIFASLLRPLVESHYEVRTDQSVDDRPRSADIVLLQPGTVLEYKGPTESARFDARHDLVELGLGIHRRLNEFQRKDKLPEMDYPEVSFWYLVNHLGQRFLAEAPTYLPGLQQETEGIWRTSVYGHPLLLVSVQELVVERDSLALHVLAGVPDEAKGTVTEALKAEPALWPSYGPWLSLHDRVIWKEVSLMAAQQQQQIPLDFGPLIEYLEETKGMQRFLETFGTKRLVEAVGVKEAVEAVGVKRAVEAVGSKQAVEALGIEQFWAGLSPEQREALLRLGRKDKPAETEQSE
jgi:hypothetical protein